MAHEARGDQIREAVREHYAAMAVRAQAPSRGCCSGAIDSTAVGLYRSGELGEVPAAAAQAALGCGNPTLLADLAPGETVLDLVQAAASTSCSPPSALAPPARPTAST